MTAERAIELLSGGTHMPAVPHSADELDEACRIACDALRLYTQSFQKAYSLNAAIADHYRNTGLSMERLDELAAADKAGRVVVLPDVSCTDADGEEALRRAMWDPIRGRCHRRKALRRNPEKPLDGQDAAGRHRDGGQCRPG